MMIDYYGIDWDGSTGPHPHPQEVEEIAIAEIIDIETTGLPENTDSEIIEYASYQVSLPEGRIHSPTEFFIQAAKSIPPESMAVHHITDEDMIDAYPIDTLHHRFFSEKPDYIVAHNASFERHFLNEYVPQESKWICTYKCALTVWPDAPAHSNQVLRYCLSLLDLDPKLAMPPHRALPDAYVTAHIFKKLLKHKTPDEMVTITENPVLLPKINFGKHSGTPFKSVPCDYLSWLTKQSNVDENVLYTAKYWLENAQ